MAEAVYTLIAGPRIIPATVSEGTPVGSGLTSSDGSPATALLEAVDHCAQGKPRLLYEYQELPRIAGFLCAFLDQIQDVEETLQALFLETLDTAEGVQLDAWGDLVGEARKDRTDGVYRVYIRVRQLVNNSDGRIEDLYAILRQAFGEEGIYSITEHPPASIQVVVSSTLGGVLPSDFILYLRQAKAGGVSLEFLSTIDPDATLIWGSALASEVWGDENNSATGGRWGFGSR